MNRPIYVTGDTHINHKKLIEWGRPVDFERRILASHADIPAQAILLHLGDFCIGRDDMSHSAWNLVTGHVKTRVLVLGNHDKKSKAWYLDRGWDLVVDQLIMRLWGKNVIFSHIPVDPKLWPEIDINVHAHTHGNGHRDRDVGGFLSGQFHREVAMELTNYYPILLTDKFVKGRQP